jgi:hypothetical protein
MRRSLVPVGIAVATLAGCGGGGSERLSRDAFVSRADAICKVAVSKQRKLPSPASIDGIPGYVGRALPIVDAMVEGISALRPPEEMQADVRRWLDLTVQARNELESLRTAAQSGDQQKVREVSAKGTAMNDRRDAQARALGLTACANT